MGALARFQAYIANARYLPAWSFAQFAQQYPVDMLSITPGLSTGTSTTVIPAAWVDTTTYAFGQKVVDVGGGGGIYVSLAAGNIGAQPSLSPSWWAISTADHYPTAAGETAGELYLATDVTPPEAFFWYGAWYPLASGGTGGGGVPYTLPTASASVLGGIKVGTGLSIDGAGILSAPGGALAAATTTTLGGIKLTVTDQVPTGPIIPNRDANGWLWAQGNAANDGAGTSRGVILGNVGALTDFRHKQVSFRVNSTETAAVYANGMGYFSGGLYTGVDFTGANDRVYLKTPSDGSTGGEVAVSTDTNGPWGSYPTNKLFAVRTGGVIKFYVDVSGNAYAGGTLLGGAYTLPTASASVLGGIKVGTNLSIDGSGILSATGGGGIIAPYTLNGVGNTVPFTINAATAQTANLQSWQVNNSEKVYIQANGNIQTTAAVGAYAYYGGLGIAFSIMSNAVDSSSAVGTTINTTATLATPGAKLLSIKNNGVEKLYVQADGGLLSRKAKSSAILDCEYFGSNGYWGFRTDVDNSFNLDLYNAAAYTTAMKIVNTTLAAGGASVGFNVIPAAGFHVASPTPATGSATGIILATANTLGAGDKVLSVRNTSTELFYFEYDGTAHMRQGYALYWGATSGIYGNGAQSMVVQGNMADGASAVGVILDTKTTLANATAKLLSVRNNAVEKFYIDKDGEAYANGVHLGAGGGITAPYTLNGVGDTVPFTINAITAQTANLQSWQVNGVEKAYIQASGNIQTTAAVGAYSYYGGVSIPFSIISNAVDGAAAVGTTINTVATLTTAGAKLLSVRNNGVEKAYIDKDGKTYTLGSLGVNTETPNIVGGGTLDPTHKYLQVYASAGWARFVASGSDGGELHLVHNSYATQNNASFFLQSRNGEFGIYQPTWVYGAATTMLKMNAGGAMAFNSATLTTAGINMISTMADGASAIGMLLNTSTAYTTTAKLLSIRNNTAEKAYVTFDGHYVGGAAYGSMYENNDPTGTTLAMTLVNTFYQWISTTAGVLDANSNVTYNGTNKQLVIGANGAGDYFVTAHLTATANVINQILEFAIFVNGTESVVRSSTKITTNNDEKSWSVQGILTLAASATVDLRIEDNTAGTVNVNIQHCGLSIRRIS
jgi:hypothetical protein